MRQGLELPSAAPAAPAEPAAVAAPSRGISIVPVDAAVVAKMRERDENMAFKCSGELSPFACPCICQGEVDINRAPALN